MGNRALPHDGTDDKHDCLGAEIHLLLHCKVLIIKDNKASHP